MTSIFNRSLDLINDRSDQVRFFIYSFIVWCGIFAIIEKKIKFKSLSKELSNDSKNRLVSIIHGAVTFWGAAFILIKYQFPLGEQNLYEDHVLMLISMGYFMYDLLCCCYYDIADMSLVMHHSLAMFGYASAIYSKYGAAATVVGLLCAEVSNFPMHSRIILRNVNLRYTKAYEACEVSYFVLYTIFRGIFVPIMIFAAWREPLCPTFVRMSATGLFVQSVYFIFEMKKLFFRMRKQQNERRKLGIHYRWITVPDIVLSLPYARSRSVKDKIF